MAAGCGRSEPASVSGNRKTLPLRPGAAVVLAGGEAHAYRIEEPASTFVLIGVEQRGIDVAAGLVDASGRPVTEVDSPTGRRGIEPLALVVDADGAPWLEVRAQAGRGSYTVRIEARRPATARDRSFVAAERAFAQAEALRRTGDGTSLRTALARYRAVLPRFHALGERPREVDVLDRMGLVHQALGEADRALVVYRAATELARGLGDRQRAWRALCGLGIAHRTRGEPERALERFREALALQPDDPGDEAGTWDLVGRAYASLGEVEGALDAYERARTIWRRLGSRGDEGATLANLGRLYALLGDDRQAREALVEALPRLEVKGKERELDGVLVDLGALHRDAGRMELAIEPLRRARRGYLRAGNRRGEAVALNEIGRLYQRAGRFAAAREAYRDALAFFHEQGYRHDEAVVLANLGRLLADAGRMEEARDAFARALPLFEVSGSRLGAATARHGLARVRRAGGDLEGALEESAQALAGIEELRREPLSLDLRSSFFASRQEAYELHIGILLDLHRRDPKGGYAARALETTERARARSFLDALERAGSAGVPPEARPAGLAEIQRQLAAGTVLLEYSLGSERSWLFALTSSSAAVLPLPRRSRIEGLAREAHSLLAAGDPTLGRGAADAALAELSRLLLAPVADRLPGRRVLLVPDGALHSVPFAALPLLEGLEVSSLPSASSLVALRRAAAGRTPAPGAVAVLADPVSSGRDPRFPPLPHSRAEARAILALVPPSESLAALGPAASRATVASGALARYRIVHFATHGVLDSERPERSGVVLSDGFLAARDLFHLRLPAELVVLSACQTALGREVPGEGVVGLTRPFFYAGARRVLVSLWPVEDEATAELMRRFYRALLRRGRAPAAALRDAQASLRREPGWESPYYWAGFVLQGEP